MKVPMKVFLKSGNIWAVTDDIKNAYTSTYNKTTPNRRVMMIPTEIMDFSQYTDRNIKLLSYYKFPLNFIQI